MARYARIDDGTGTVAEILDEPVASGFVPGVDILVGLGSWIDVSDQPQVGDGWSYGSGGFSAPVPPVPSLAEALAALDAFTQAREASGILFQAAGASAPSLMPTDVASQGKILSAFVAAGAGLWTPGTPWKMADGSFVPFTTADVLAAAQYALKYVAACATAEAAVAVLVGQNPGLDITQASLWPANGPFLMADLAGGSGVTAATAAAVSTVGDTAAGSWTVPAIGSGTATQPDAGPGTGGAAAAASGAGGVGDAGAESGTASTD